MYDIVIKNGMYPDFSEGKFKLDDVAVKDGKIVKIGSIFEESTITIDATDRIISPGFIDIHMHEERFLQNGKKYDISEYMLKMGVTTCLGGNCGSARQPLQVFKDTIHSLGGAPVNYMMQAGYNTARVEMGIDHYKSASKDQIHILAEKMQEDILNGAYGISFGLEYDPGITYEEIMEVLNAQPQKDLYVSAHYREDSKGALKSIDEMIRIANESGKRFQVSHLSSCSAMGQMKDSLDILNKAMKANPRIQYDTYPYIAFATTVGTAVFDDGCFENWGKSYENIWMTDGKYKNQFCTKETFEEIRKNDPSLRVVAFVMNEEEIAAAISNPVSGMIGSDGGVTNGTGHPRSAGTFPRVLGKYVREDHCLSLIDALYKMTQASADRLELTHKGRIQVGCDADITIFDPKTIADGATFEHLDTPVKGIDSVIVNGKLALRNNVILNDRAGIFIPGPYMK